MKIQFCNKKIYYFIIQRTSRVILKNSLKVLALDSMLAALHLTKANLMLYELKLLLRIIVLHHETNKL